MLSLRNTNNCKLLRDNNVTELVVQSIKIHSQTSQTKKLVVGSFHLEEVRNFEFYLLIVLQKNACWLIKNLSQGTEQFSADFLNLGVEECLREILKNHVDCTFEVNTALRVLGCEVESKDIWTGQGKAMTN